MEVIGGFTLVSFFITLIIEGAKKFGVSANTVYALLSIVGGVLFYVLTNYAPEEIVVGLLAMLGAANRIYEWLIKPMKNNS